jgi:tRNA pseudouridine13 synthase
VHSDVQADSPEAIADAVETLRSKGFINYYGMQRFGTAPIPTHAIGLALLRSDWALATNLILRQREGDPDDTTDSRNALFNDKNLEKAMKLMPRRCVAEKASTSFSAYRLCGIPLTAFLRQFLNITFTTRMKMIIFRL